MSEEMCGKHSAEWTAWLSYRTKPSPQIVQIGNSSVARMREAAEARFRQWRDTIRSQQGLIKQCCAAGDHCGTAEEAFKFSALER